jgi:hypothetical protein
MEPRTTTACEVDRPVLELAPAAIEDQRAELEDGEADSGDRRKHRDADEPRS